MVISAIDTYTLDTQTYYNWKLVPFYQSPPPHVPLSGKSTFLLSFSTTLTIFLLHIQVYYAVFVFLCLFHLAQWPPGFWFIYVVTNDMIYFFVWMYSYIFI